MMDVGLLRDPETGERLSLVGSWLESPSGGRFSIVEGVPIMLPRDSLFSTPCARTSPARGLKSTVRACLPPATVSIGSAKRYAEFARLLRTRNDRPRVLVIGGGRLGDGMDALVRSSALELVETDVYMGPRTSVVCDAHQLPFADRSFDGVVAQAVLEHVVDPTRVIAEAIRVLRPGGLAYTEIPFMQQVHEGAYDFTRFTLTGHRRLLRQFEELDAGVLSGPATALAWSVRYFLRSLPRRSSLARAALDVLARIVLGWLPQLDRLLVTRPSAEDAASSTYFLGRLLPAPLSDGAIIASYAGGQKRAPR